MQRIKWLALLLPGLALLMAPTGGYPSRPQFISAGVGVAAPATGLTVAVGTTAVQALTATTGAFTGAVTGASHSGGPHSGTTGAFTGAITGASYSGGPISGTTGTYTGAITGAGYSGGPISGTTGAFSGAVTGASYSGGTVSGTTGTFTTGAAISGGNFSSRGISDLAASTVESIASNGPVTFSGQSTTPAAYGGNALNITTPATAGASNGIYIAAGTNSTDHNLFLANQANTVALLEVYGDGGIIVGNSPTGGDKGAGTINTAGSLYMSGVQVPQHAWATLTGSGSCAISHGANVSSCVRTATGLYTITLASIFASAPTCTSQYATGTPNANLLNATTATNITMINENIGTLAAVDFATLNIICVGT